MIDLSQIFNKGINNIRTWRNRYNASEYPSKVVLNIFYRKYTMEAMWEQMLMYMNQHRDENLKTAVNELMKIYSTTALTKIHPTLQLSLIDYSDKEVGGTSYAAFEENIQKASKGDSVAKEEIEYAYLYYLVADYAIILWAGVCSTGVDKIKAIEVVSDHKIGGILIDSYTKIKMILERWYASPYLHTHYNPNIFAIGNENMKQETKPSLREIANGDPFVMHHCKVNVTKQFYNQTSTKIKLEIPVYARIERKSEGKEICINFENLHELQRKGIIQGHLSLACEFNYVCEQEYEAATCEMNNSWSRLQALKNEIEYVTLFQITEQQRRWISFLINNIVGEEDFYYLITFDE